MTKPLGWLGIIRLGLVQTSLGAVVVLMTSTINRVMIVELGLLATLPGALIGLHYVVQLARPRFGHGADAGGRRTPWIVAGMGVLCFGGVLASLSLYAYDYSWALGVSVSTIAFLLIGAGVGASGTLLLVLLAVTVSPERRAAAATTTWLMMIAGFIVTTIASAAFLEPFSLDRLLLVTATVAAIAFIVTCLAVAGIEQRHARPSDDATTATTSTGDFRAALRDVASEPRTRRFALFVFVSMLAYSGLDVLLEPFAGAVHNMTPAATTQLTGLYSQGLLAGMLLVAWLGSWRRTGGPRAMRWCMLFGCLGSALGLGALAATAGGASREVFVTLVIVVGLTNGLFAVAAIGSMMGLVSQGTKGRDGVRMGVWGAAQALAFGSGALLGGAMIDVLRQSGVSVPASYATVFVILGLLYTLASALVVGLETGKTEPTGARRQNPLHAAAALDIK
ncbi:MAG: BCD family MFS transporter [Pseudomonadota bacterium]